MASSLVSAFGIPASHPRRYDQNQSGNGVEQTRGRGGFRAALTCSLDKFSVQFECDDGNGEVSQVQLQGTGDGVDVGVGTGADVSLVSVCRRENTNEATATQM